MAASRAAIHTAAEHHIFDELKDWIDARPDWDGVARLDDWLTTYAGADPKAHTAEYLALIGSKYIMQVLNRALNPGAKADYSLVFTALQGVGKDRVLEAMFAPYYREGIPSPRVSQADFALGIAGAIVAHGAEMSAWRKSDVEEQKAALTRCVDHGRPRLRLRGALLSAAHLPRLLAPTTSIPAGRDRRSPLLALRRDPRSGRHRGAAPRPRPDSGGGAAPAEGRRAALADAGGGGAPHRPRTAEIHAGGGAGDPRHPGAVHRRGAADDAAEPRGLRLEMAAPATTSEGALPRRLLRECFGMYAAVKRQGLDRASKEGHHVLHDMAPRERLAAGEKAPAGRTKGAWSGERRGGWQTTPPQAHPKHRSLGVVGREGVADGRCADVADVADVASVAGAAGSATQHRCGSPTQPKHTRKMFLINHLTNHLIQAHPKRLSAKYFRK